MKLIAIAIRILNLPDRITLKRFLMLKLTAVFCLLFIIQVNAAVFSQNVSIHLKNASLQDVFKSIEKQTAYTFLYDVQ